MNTERVEYGLQLNCAKNNCIEPHNDDGRVMPLNPKYDEIPPHPDITVNGHAVTFVQRTITIGKWEVVQKAMI